MTTASRRGLSAERVVSAFASKMDWTSRLASFAQHGKPNCERVWRAAYRVGGYTVSALGKLHDVWERAR
jgi:hypothetical protein